MKTTGLGALMKKKLAPVQYVVDGIIPVGLTMIAGKPKYGKSWMTYDLAISVSLGREWLDAPTQQGDVLLMALEDPEARTQFRGEKLLDGDEPTDALQIANITSRITADNVIENITEWAEESDLPRLVVIDTVKHVRGATDNRGSAYDMDYTFLTSFQQLAMRLKIAIVVVFHTGKTQREDPMDEVQGTTGITAACDQILVLRKKRRDNREATLHTMGRDGVDEAMALEQDPSSARWKYVGDADTPTQDTQRSALRQAVLDVIAKQGKALTPAEVSRLVGEGPGKVRTYMRRMAVDYGELKRLEEGTYELTSSIREEFGTTTPSWEELDKLPREEVKTILSPAEYAKYHPGRNDRRKAARVAPAKTSVPKKSVRPRKLVKPSVPTVTALKSKWTKPLSEVAEMPTMTLFKMNKNGEFSEDDYDAITTYREERRQKARDAFDESIPKPTARKAVKKAVRPTQRVREHSDEDAKEGHTRRTGIPKRRTPRN